MGDAAGMPSSCNLDVNLTESDVEPLSRNIFVCDIPITPATLNEILEHLYPQKEAQSVSVEVMRDILKISTVGLPAQGKSWKVLRKDMMSGQNHRALFKLPHLESMREASSLARVASISLLFIPGNHILMHLKFKKLGEVMFLYKARELKTGPDEDSPGGDATEASQPSVDADEASQHGGDAAEASQPGGDAAEG